MIRADELTADLRQRKANAEAAWQRVKLGDLATGITLADSGEIAVPPLPNLPGKGPAR